RFHGQGARRGLRMGAAVVVAAGPEACQSMGIGPLPHAGRRHANPRPRHVRALLPHRFRRQGCRLCRHFHGVDPFSERRSPVQPGIHGTRGGSVNRATGPDRRALMSRILPLLFGGAVVAFASSAMAQQVDWQKVDDAFGRKGAVAGDVHRYGFPRTDLQVTLDGVQIKPGFALGGWVAFKQMEGGAMAMGDLVLLETEINPVMSKLIENGMEITAVHNHLLRANPATFYMHVGGHGDPVKMANAIKTALAESKTPLATPAPAAQQPAVDLDTAQLDQIIGVKG